MEKFINILVDLGIIGYLLVALGISVNAIGQVYLWGTLTGIVVYWRYKSTIGIVTMLLTTIFYTLSHKVFKTDLWILSYYMVTMFHLSIAIYTVFLIKLRERMDKALDRRLGKDGGERYRRLDKRKKKTKRK
jgi:ABC-type Fe3+-siderophore transport system permease subunit